MRDNQDDTPPSSVNGDEISSMDEEGVIYLDEMEEVQLEDLEAYVNREEEDIDMEPPEDLAALVFDKHVGSVFCCDLHPEGKLAVTGGEDDKAFVWSVETGQEVMNCVGHKDSVIFAGFSFDGAYLATVDMAGLIKVWKVNTESNDPWSVAFEYEADDMAWGLWHFGARVLICGADAGDIFVFKIPSGETKVLLGHNSKVECGKLFHDGMRLVAGYEDGMVKIWDLKSSSVVHQIAGSGPQARGNITAVDVHPEDNVIAAISTDGRVTLATTNNGKIVGEMETEMDLESVAFLKDSEVGYLALGTLNGAVSIWDVARQMVRHYCAKSDDDDAAGVIKMLWVKDHLVTGCLDGSIRVYHTRTGERSLVLTGHRTEILDLCYNAKQNVLLATSEDGAARIFKYEVNKDKD